MLATWRLRHARDHTNLADRNALGADHPRLHIFYVNDSLFPIDGTAGSPVLHQDRPVVSTFFSQNISDILVIIHRLSI